LQKPITELIKQRYSCRTYQDKPIVGGLQRLLSDFLASNSAGPLGARARFVLVAATDRDRQPLKGLGTYGLIKGATGFIVGAAERAPRDLEDYGYLMEHAVLFATDLGLGTCWLGGTFSKSGFAKKIAVTSREVMPAVAAVGYIAEGNKSRHWIRKRAGSDLRFPWESLFFDEGFGKPLAPERAGPYAEPLETVRLAPSASNRQPWRIVRVGDVWHFFLQRTKGYGKGSLLFWLLHLADLQRVDMGIAMCHFELTAREIGLAGHWMIDEPDIEKLDESMEYSVSWRTAVV
jgi:nitroreductase